MDFKVKDMTATILDRGLLYSERVPAYTAIVKHVNGDWIGVSRYVDEDEWTADCFFRANGFPVFSNGTGTRITSRRVMSDENVIAALDEYALMAGPLSPID